MDIVSVLLGIVIVLIFMAIFTLLRTMNSPFIHRFEQIVGSPLQGLSQRADAYAISFAVADRRYTLYEIKCPAKSEEGTAYKDYIFLRVETTSPLQVRFIDELGKAPRNNLLADLLGSASVSGYHDFLPEAGIAFEDLKVITNDVTAAKAFLSDERSVQIFSAYKVTTGTYGLLIPFIIDAGSITLDYRLTKKGLNEIIANPRAIKQHVVLLSSLADALEKRGAVVS